MKLTTVAEQRALALLDEMRQTPMRRGALSEQAWQVRSDVAETLARNTRAQIGLSKRQLPKARPRTSAS